MATWREAFAKVGEYIKEHKGTIAVALAGTYGVAVATGKRSYMQGWDRGYTQGIEVGREHEREELMEDEDRPTRRIAGTREETDDNEE